MTSICTPVLTILARATWDDFQEAFDTMEVGSVARKDVENAYHWVAARTRCKWNSGGTMSAGDRATWLAWNAPFKFEPIRCVRGSA